MATKIGKVGYAIALPDPMTWDSTGDQVTATWTMQTTTASDAVRVRDQLLGLVDPFQDEPVVPVTVDNETRLNGFYRVTGVDVITDPAAIAKGNLSFTVQLERIQGMASPLIETIFSSALRTNAIGGVLGDTHPAHAVPAAVTEYTGMSNHWGTLQALALDGVTATTIQRYLSGSGLGVMFNGSARYALPIGNFYDGSCTVERGSPFVHVVGRQNTVYDTNWRIGNGLVRLTTPGGSGPMFQTQWWMGSSWSLLTKDWRFRAVGATGTLTADTIKGMTILRNSPEEVAVRFAVQPTNVPITPNRVYIDAVIRRGRPQIYFYLTSVNADQWEFGRGTAEAADNATSHGAIVAGAAGIQAHAADSDGNKFLLYSVQQILGANDLVNGRVELSGTATTMDVFLSVWFPAAPPPSFPTPLEALFEYLTADAESQRVVGR